MLTPWKRLKVNQNERAESLNKRRIGTFYEEAVSEYLKSHGIDILQKNYRCKYGEIDLIGKDGETTVFFEVKYRKNYQYGNPLEAVTKQKQRTICKCAAFFCYNHKNVREIRYDVIGVLDEEIIWIKNAFEHDGYAFL